MIFVSHSDCFGNSHSMLYKVTLPVTPMKSRTDNDVKR